LSGEDVTDVYYFTLLYHLGCTASADRQAQVAAGDEVSSRRWFSEADYTDRGDLGVLFGAPLAAAIVARSQLPDLPFVGAFVNAFVVMLAFNHFDWLVLDWLVFCTLTPGFVVLPGTEGMAGYKDYAMHFRGFLIGLGFALAAIGAITLVHSV